MSKGCTAWTFGFPGKPSSICFCPCTSAPTASTGRRTGSSSMGRTEGYPGPAPIVSGRFSLPCSWALALSGHWLSFWVVRPLSKDQTGRIGEFHSAEMGQGAAVHIPFEDHDIATALVAHQKEFPAGVQGEVPGPVPQHGFPAYQGQGPAVRVHGKDHDTVLPAVRTVEKTAVGGKVQVRTGIIAAEGGVQGFHDLDLTVPPLAVPFKDGNTAVELIDHVEVFPLLPKIKVTGSGPRHKGQGGRVPGNEPSPLQAVPFQGVQTQVGH